jgi:hypothetical protein
LSLGAVDRVARWGRLIRRHYLLLAKAWGLLVVIRITLTARSYRPVLARIKRTGVRDGPGVPLPILAWAVELMAPLVPRASCLTQALALRYLAAREGEECTIRIGVRQKPGEAFDAHAWVLAGDAVMIGGQRERIEDFTPIVDL